jgi:hypothetical protein
VGEREGVGVWNAVPLLCVALCEERENNKREREMRARVCE